MLQIDSEGDYILWGDVGVGNLFIREEDLKRAYAQPTLGGIGICKTHLVPGYKHIFPSGIEGGLATALHDICLNHFSTL